MSTLESVTTIHTHEYIMNQPRMFILFYIYQIKPDRIKETRLLHSL